MAQRKCVKFIEHAIQIKITSPLKKTINIEIPLRQINTKSKEYFLANVVVQTYINSNRERETAEYLRLHTERVHLAFLI